MALRAVPTFLRTARKFGLRAMSNVGEYGSGAGKGGGSGGTIRDAGGSFGRMEAAHEEEYFRRLREEQLRAFKKQVQEENAFHDDEIRRHEEAITRHKKRIEELQQKQHSDSN